MELLNALQFHSYESRFSGEVLVKLYINHAPRGASENQVDLYRTISSMCLTYRTSWHESAGDAVPSVGGGFRASKCAVVIYPPCSTNVARFML